MKTMGAQIRTVFFLGLLTGLLIIAGGILGGETGLIIGFIFALIMNVFSYWFSDKIVLAMYRARQVSETEAPALHRVVDEVRNLAQLPKPRLYIIENPSPNAFATGRSPKHSAIAVTTGLLQLLNEDELRGVIAHEFSHIKNRDILIQSVAAVIAGTIAYLAFMARWAAIFGGFGGRNERGSNIIELLAIAIITPIIATLIQLAISRSREYLADETAAKTMHSYLPLVSALKKLEAGVNARPMVNANRGTAHMFIVNPFSSGGFLRLFMTHPPIKDRIEHLQKINF